ncbi:hypothetical protein MHY83_26840, partial [Klebsiella quasipneumoniae subsp. similipneumoniae]|nr:hypothetical protein [Klebsiella quasipneumoniae subsp. similipneumoniae]
LMMNPVPWLQMTNMISYQGLVRTFPRVVDKLWELTNSASVFLTTLFFAKRPELYSLLQKLLSKTEEVSLSDIAPATFQHVQLLCRHGLVTYTKKHKILDIHSVSVLIEGLHPL